MKLLEQLVFHPVFAPILRALLSSDPSLGITRLLVLDAYFTYESESDDVIVTNQQQEQIQEAFHEALGQRANVEAVVKKGFEGQLQLQLAPAVAQEARRMITSIAGPSFFETAFTS